MNEVDSYGEKNVELLLLGNKSDDDEKRVVTSEKGKVLHKLYILYTFLLSNRATHPRKTCSFLRQAPK